jgi:hypothetical protein
MRTPLKPNTRIAIQSTLALGILFSLPYGWKTVLEPEFCSVSQLN